MAAPPPPAGAPEPSAAAAAGAAAAALLQKQLAGDQPPSGDKIGWSEHQTGDGRKFFYHEDTQTSRWEKPEVLMTGEERKNDTMWREYRIWDGRVFYHNRETKVSCWSMPPEIRRLRGESSGIDETPLPNTSAEKRRGFWDTLRERGVNENWTWEAVEEATGTDAGAQELSLEVKKQCFAELVGLCLRVKEIEAREKQRNAASALERLIEERFGNPEDLGTSYEEAASLLHREEPWQMIKSDMRRDEVFQTVMERLEEKHQKARADKRHEQTARYQRLMATDAEMKRPRLRWKDVAELLQKKDELHEEDPPLEALRVWASLRDLKAATEHELDSKKRTQPEKVTREERKRRDAFFGILRELAVKGQFSQHTAWSEVENFAKNDVAFLVLKEGPGATAMELFDEFQEDLARGVSPQEAGLGFEVDLATPADTVVVSDRDRPGAVKAEAKAGGVKAEEPASKRAKIEAGAPPPPPVQPGMVRTKQELLAKAAQPGLLAAKTEAEPSPLDQLLAAADAMDGGVAAAPAGQAVSTPLTKEELLDPSSRPPTGKMAKEEMLEAVGGADPLAVPAVPQKRVIAPKVEETPPATGSTQQTFTKTELNAKKVDDLRELCRSRGLQVSGRKQELVDRLAGN